jgi:hypothetical protein
MTLQLMLATELSPKILCTPELPVCIEVKNSLWLAHLIQCILAILITLKTDFLS